MRLKMRRKFCVDMFPWGRRQQSLRGHMPCNLISSCFFLESPWFNEVNCGGDWQNNNSQLVSEHQPSMGSTQNSEPGQETEQKKVSKTFREYLPDCHRTYSCVHCRAHLANHDELISKSFQGSQGRAYLFNSVVNVGCGPAEERVLLTGLHAVADIFCDCCKTTLGWKYEHAFESSQKYKEGKFIIELAHMIKENGWEKESWRYVTLDNINFLQLIGVSSVSWNVMSSSSYHSCQTFNMITLPGSIDEIETIDLLSKNQSHSSFFQINFISHSVHKKHC